MIENWKPVVGYEALYEVSDQGRVRRNGRVLKPSFIDGYSVVSLCRDGTQKTRHIHALVAAVWIGPKPTPAHEVAHGDGVRSNNAALNLRWATPLENQSDRKIHGTLYEGERTHTAKLTAEQVVAILNDQRPNTEVGRSFGVSTFCIWAIKAGRTWKSIDRSKWMQARGIVR